MYRFFVLFGISVLAACANEQPSVESEKNPLVQTGELAVSSAWIRSAPPSSEVLGGYMAVDNGLGHKVKILSASSLRFRSVEFHQMTMNDGQMRMRELPEIAVPANTQETFSPGNKHLMLFKPTSPLRSGERVLVSFVVQNPVGENETLDVWFLVRDSGPQE